MNDDFAKRLSGFDKVWKRVSAGRESSAKNMARKNPSAAYRRSSGGRNAVGSVNTGTVGDSRSGGDYRLMPRKDPGSSATRYGTWPHR